MTQREVYIVDGARTPFLKVRGRPGSFSASDLAVSAGRELLARQSFSPTEVGEVILGCVIPSANETNIARIVGLRLGCGDAVPAWTVQRNCASGMQALDSAFEDIMLGRHELVLAGGTEAMSRAPILFSDAMVNWMSNFAGAKGFLQKLKQITRFRPGFLAPLPALLKGLNDPVVNLSMGQTAENLAYQFKISREQMDAFSLASHQKVAAAQDAGYLKEIEPIYTNNGEALLADDGLRRDTSMGKLAQLKPFFDKKFGMVTAGNSSQISDGAALLLLASKEAVKKYNLPVLARIIDTQWAALDPSIMGLGPVYASTKLMQRFHLNINDIDYWEINEAFATQVLACVAAWQDDEYCRKHLGLTGAFGRIDLTRLNVDGGAVALGHPVGASGARIVLHLAHVLRRNNAKKGIATICIGGGQGGAMLIENVSEVSA